jgi:glutamate racemase
VAGKKVTLVDSAESCADYVFQRLKELGLLNRQRKDGKVFPFVTDDTERFENVAGRFFKGHLQDARRIQLPLWQGRDAIAS